MLIIFLFFGLCVKRIWKNFKILKIFEIFVETPGVFETQKFEIFWKIFLKIFEKSRGTWFFKSKNFKSKNFENFQNFENSKFQILKLKIYFS